MLSPYRLNRVFRTLLLATFAATAWTAPVVAQDCDGNGLSDLVDESGAIFYTSTNTSTVYRFDIALGISFPVIDLANDKFISGIDVDPDEDKLYMAIENEGVIYRCNLDGTGLETDWQTGINEPNDIALRKPGSVFVTRRNTVTIFPPASFSVGLSFPYTVDRIDEDTAVAFAIGSGTISRILDGPTEPATSQTIVTGVSLASGLAYTNGQVFWADTGSGILMRADVGAGQDINVTPMFAPPPSSELTGVAANRDNNRIFFGTQDPDILYRIEADATFLTPILVLPQNFGLYAIAHLPGSRDCNNNGVQDACDIADPSKDCNGDYILDVCQLDGNTDLNNNDILDECEPDCDFNGRPDDFDIAQGAGDCDNNNIPDQCENPPGVVFRNANVLGINYLDGTTSPFFGESGFGAATDQLTGKVYWTHGGDLRRADFDGTNVEIVPTSVSATDVVKVDSLRRTLYFTTGSYIGGTVGVRSINLDTLAEESVLAPSLRALTVDVSPDNEWVFYRYGGTSLPDEIRRVNFDGTDDILVFPGGGANLGGVEFDEVHDKLYFFENCCGTDTIYVANADGSNRQSFLNEAVSDIELDAVNENLYYVQRFFSENGPPFVLLSALFRKSTVTSEPPVQMTDYVNANPLTSDIRGLILPPIDCNENGVPDSCESLTDCNNDGTPDVCQLFGNDCNANGTLDECEIATGDCNSNGIPDDCDPDCNGDGTPDDCQLAGNDCNSNGVIDDCDLLPTLDQINLDIGSTAATNIQTPREQTFTPAASVLNGLQIGLANGSFDFPNDFITVKVFRDATMIGSATREVFRPITGLTTFYFDMPIVTTPGELLSFTVESDFGLLVFFWEYSPANTYPGGTRIFAGTPAGDWRFATIELRPFSQDCDNDGTLDDCEPTFVDCNLNGTYDICELVDNDCNANGVPDDCDAAVLDCNNDGIPDDCQLAANDCNEDGIPDECNLADSDCNNNGLVDQCEFEPQIDQSHVRDESFGNFQQGNNSGQTFTPTFELIEAIEVGLRDNTSSGNSEVISLRLLRGSDVLATVNRTVTAPVAPLTRFTFNEPVAVTPGELLEFQLNDSGFIRFFWNQGPFGSTYDGGQGTFFGGPYGSDRSFQTLGRPQIFVDCNMNEVPDDCELMVRDCNNNGLLDDCEGLPDCDGDGVPDECELAEGDCNGDGTPDDCQLITDDCNSNGILDECEIAGGIFNYGATPNIAIPDDNPIGITSVVNVPFNGTINDLNVNLHINHTWHGDIIATLEHNGTVVTLINNSGGVALSCTTSPFGYRANNFGTAGNPLVLDDSAPVSIDCYDGPTSDGIDNYAGPAMPHQQLAAFNGMNAGGAWTLTVSDPLAQELGTLVSWSLDIDGASADCNGNTIPDDCELNDITFYALGDDTDQILFLDEFGNSVRPAIDLPGGLYRAVGYHAVAQIMLYSNLSTDEIVRVNLDGSDASTIISGSPQGRAFDFEFPSTGTDFYYCTGNSGSLYRATLSGTITTLIENAPLINNISGLALDEASNSIYFTDQATGRIWRRNLITTVNVQIASGLSGPLEIELDRIGGKLYFTEFSGRSVRRMNLDGSGLETIYDSSGFAGGLELDIANGKVYFTDINTDQLLRCDLDGSNLQEIASVADVFRIDASISNTDCNGNGVPDSCDIPSSGDCCVTDNTPGCNVQAIQDCVCAADPFCCNNEWDQLCVNQVESLGCGSCSTATFSNDCNFNFIPDECETENDCNGNFIPDECENPLQGCGPGEECPDAIAIDAGTFTGDLGDNLGTTGNDDSCGNGENGNNIDEWYRISVPFDTVVTITTCNGGTQFDSVLSVFDGCPIDGGVQIACNDDTFGAPPECGLGGGNFNRKSTISVNAFAGEDYLIRVSPYNNLFNVQGGFGTQLELTVDYCFKGDLNEDYLVDAIDVPLFVERLIDDTLVNVANRCDADMNDDGSVNGADLHGFVIALLGS